MSWAELLNVLQAAARRHFQNEGSWTRNRAVSLAKSWAGPVKGLART
jgi:hypothetical protein